MKARWPVTIIMLLLLSAPAWALPLLGKYTFTFHDTVAESLEIWDGDAVGFDFTGFGYSRDKKFSNGIMLRAGIQAPITTLNSLVTINGLTYSMKDEKERESMDPSKWNYDRQFKFVTLFGPSVRYVYSDEMTLYAGFGPRITIDNHTIGNISTKTSTTYDRIQIALDFEFGTYFHLPSDLSCQVGLYGFYDIFSYTRVTTEENEKKETMIMDTVLNDRMYHLTAYGFIVMTHSFDL